MSSHEDSTTGRNQEEKETEVVEEVDVEADPVLGGVTEAVGGGGDDPAAGGGGGSVRVGGSGSSTFSDAEVRAMPPSRQLEVVAQGQLLERQLRGLLGGPSKTPKELLQSLLLANAEAVAAADAQVAAEAARKASAAEAEAAVDAKVAAEAALAEARTQVSAAQAAAEAALAEARAQASAAQVVAEAQLP